MNKYGLIGKKLSHSYSEIIHKYLFAANNIDALYTLIEVEENELLGCINDLKCNLYKGYNVTIPYKEAIMKYCDILTDSAKEIGAVNTIYLKDGMVVGDNTDYVGFIRQLKYYNIDVYDKDVYVLGNGGSSKAIKYALKELGANVFVVSRSGAEMSYETLMKINHYDLLINTTPLGMYPNIDNSILDECYIKKADICIDLIYNPKITKFLSFANEGYNGLSMLIFQAVKAEEIWQGHKLKYDLEEIEGLL